MQHDAPTESEANRLDRRQAMKAALGGAAAAAVFTAPRIEGFSTAPNYASAVTDPPCVDKAANSTLSRSVNSTTCAVYRCWGTGGCTGCNTAQSLGTTTVTPPTELPPYLVPSLTGTVTGQIKNTGSYSLNLSNFDDGKPYNRCVVSLNGSCSGSPGTVTANPSSITRNTNGNFTGSLICSSSTLYPNATVSVNMTCYCTGN